MTISKITPLKESDANYRFFRDDEGQAWKALLTINSVRSANLNTEADLATVLYSVTISVSPVGEDGEALRDEADMPIVIDSHTHTFTEEEMKGEDFDPDARILAIVSERIEAGSKIVAGNERLVNLASQW